MKVLLASIAASFLIAIVANVVLTRGFQESSEHAFSAYSAKP